MALQIVQGSQVDTPTTGVKMDGTALRQAALAPGQVGAALGGDVADTLQNVSQSLQQAKNVGIAADADRVMRQTSDAFRQSLVGRTDEDQWVNDWQDKAQQARDAVLDKANPGPALKRQLNNNFAQWETAGAGEFGIKAKLQSINRSQQQVNLAANQSAKDGDLDGVNSVIDLSVKNHVFFPEQGAQMKVEYGNKIDKYAADNYINNDPAHAEAFLKATDDDGDYTNLRRLTPDQRSVLLRDAHREKNNTWQDNLNDKIGAYDPSNPPTKQEVQSWADSGQISSRGANSFLQMMKGQNIGDAKDERDIQMKLAYDHDFSTDDNAAETARKMKDDAAALPPQFYKQVASEIDNRLKAAQNAGRSTERPIETDVLSRMKNDPLGRDGIGSASKGIGLLKEKGQDGEFSVSDDDIKTRYGSDATRESVIGSLETKIRQGQLDQARKFDKMRQWFKDPANKDATDEQAEQYRQSLNAPGIEDAVKNALKRGHGLIPPNNHTQAPAEFSQ